MKTCSSCGEEKPLSDFPKGKRYKDGHRGQCFVCKRIKQAEYDEKNIEAKRKRGRERMAERRKNPKERGVLLEATRTWRSNNPESSKESSTKSNLKWRETSPERYADVSRRATKKYRESNKERHVAHMRLGAAILSGRVVKPTCCDRCGFNGRLDGHHDSYLKEHWYDVTWLCRKCHKKEHNKKENQ